MKERLLVTARLQRVIAIPDCRCNHSRQRSLTTAAPPLSGDEVAPFFFLSFFVLYPNGVRAGTVKNGSSRSVPSGGELPLITSYSEEATQMPGQRHVHQMREGGGSCPRLLRSRRAVHGSFRKTVPLSNFRVFGGAYDPSK
jgi:hypothetical protein